MVELYYYLKFLYYIICKDYNLLIEVDSAEQ